MICCAFVAAPPPSTYWLSDSETCWKSVSCFVLPPPTSVMSCDSIRIPAAWPQRGSAHMKAVQLRLLAPSDWAAAEVMSGHFERMISRTVRVHPSVWNQP
eukprot:3357328-Prymnesium_polylepis.2